MMWPLGQKTGQCVSTAWMGQGGARCRGNRWDLGLRTGRPRESERAPPTHPHEGSSLAGDGRPCWSRKTGAMFSRCTPETYMCYLSVIPQQSWKKNPQTGARSTCPHREPHPQDRDTGYRGRGNFLRPTARILTLSMSSLGSAHFLLAQSEREADPEPRGPEDPCPPRPSVSQHSFTDMVRR